uniref:Uncharacterized protein n=2 Tax=Plectus sambesii TaxID=2011161 RepID=A0A914VAX4_9BILA
MDGVGQAAAPPMLLLPTTTDSGCMRPPVICEQGPSAPSSPTSPGGSRIRRPSPLTPEAMRRINLLTSGYPQSMEMNKLSPLSPNYPTSDLGSSPRSSISVTTSGLGPFWTGFRDHKKSSSDFTDGDSDICSKDLLSPGMMLSPAPFSPFSDCTDPPGTPYSAYGAGGLSPNLSPLLPVRGLHFSFDPIRSPSSLSMGNSGNYLLVPYSAGPMGMGRLTKESRERSRSDSEMASSAKKMAEEESAMETDMLQSTVSVPSTTAIKSPGNSSGQYKKRLLHKYEQEQEREDHKFTRARLSPPDHPEPSPPAVAEGSEVEEGERTSRQPSRQPTIEEPPRSPSPEKPPQQLSSAVKNALSPQPQFDYWLQQQLLAWQNAWYRNPTLLPPAGVQLPTPHGLIGVHAPSPQLLAPPPLAGHLPRGNLRHTPSPEAGPGGAPGPMK